MYKEISEIALNTVETNQGLSDTDKSIIQKLSVFDTKWITINDALIAGRPLKSRDELLTWLRRQSVNKMTSMAGNELAGFTVIKTWMYDPSTGKVFFTIDPRLFEAPREGEG